jgi:hypothetical protein
VIKGIKQAIESAVSLEGTTGVGKLNQSWCVRVFVVWLIMTILGFSLKYTPAKDWNPLNGFELDLMNPSSTLMLIVVILSPLACMGILLWAYNQGWLKEDKF